MTGGLGYDAPQVFASIQQQLYAACYLLRERFGMTDTNYVPYTFDSEQKLLFKLVGSIGTIPSNGGAATYSGSGSPEGVVTAAVGSIYTDTGTPTTVYVKTSGTGNTGWTLLISV